jgi:PAS domain S-box-containing protein
MAARSVEVERSEVEHSAARFVRMILWPVLAIVALALAAGALVARMVGGERYDNLLMVAVVVAAIAVAVRILFHGRERPDQSAVPGAEIPSELLESAGAAIAAVDLEGRVIFVNSTAQRMLGYHAEELAGAWIRARILAPGEGTRLVAEMRKLAGIDDTAEPNPIAPIAAYLDCVRELPPSMVPSFDVQLLRKDGVPVPATVHISALRSASNTITGLIAVAVDQSATHHREQALRESQDRYRDLFENSNEMIATLSPTGQFLYVNPAWKRCFDCEDDELLSLESFEEVFAPSCRGQAASLFRRALDGEAVERAVLRHHAADGRVLDLEISLSQRQRSGNPLAIRCLLRDVTQQRQREHRLALQLAVSQILGENIPAEQASTRILEALCVAHGWDAAIKWKLNEKQDGLEFSTAWGYPGRRAETVIRESMGARVICGAELAGRAWKEGRPVWYVDLTTLPTSPRIQSALRQDMVSGWAVPVRVGDKTFAVLEFFCRYALREDRDAIATVETVATSLGQMLARAEERSRAEELYRRQQVLLDSVADGICGLDHEGRVSFANPAAARMLSAEADTLTGKSVHALLHGSAHPDRACGEDCLLKRNASLPRPTAGEDNIFRADGSPFPAEYALTPIPDQGHYAGSVLSFRDISQRYALDRLKDEFISTVSHELRTPLTSIRGALGLLSSGILNEVSEKAANLLRIALTNSDRLVRLINDILDLERIQSGKQPLAFRTMQLAEIIRQAIDGMQPVADAAGVQLFHDTTQVEVSADPDRLLQVFTNLLSNAVKFSPPGSSVSVMMRPGVTGVTLSVIDHGRGIPADKLESIFDRFQQVDASDSRQKGGSGLGLAICRSIVLQHSGRIWAERNPVRGSTFRLFLPYQPVPLEPGEPPTGEPRSGTVVLAGAGPDVRPRISAQLVRHGYRVIETSTVEQTLAAAEKSVQAILLDTAIDGMNGWEILPLLRRLDPESRTPVVLLSVDGAHANVELPLGVDGQISKPLDEGVLLSELARVLCGPGDKARILVIEDDHDLARVIAEIFSQECIQVHCAHTLQEAIDACFAFQPHLIVLDIGLPDGNGFNIVDWLRKNESLAGLPLVVYSGRELSPVERHSLTLGPTHFLAKARVQPQQLEALVLTMLRRSRMMEDAPAVRESSVPNP